MSNTITVRYLLPFRIEDEGPYFGVEQHDILYQDKHCMLTSYECCYALWSLPSGNLIMGNLWKKGEWRLDFQLSLPFYRAS